MKKSLSVILVVFSVVLSAQTPANDPHWELFFFDEFNGTEIDQTKWYVSNNTDGQVTTKPGKVVPVAIDDNVSVSGGYLICKTDVGPYSCPPEYVAEWWCTYQYLYGYPYPFTSGGVVTKPEHNFKYGYIEARMKVPAGPSLWSAFWTFRGNGVPGGPNTANEIDIFEILSSSTTVKTNLHWDYCPEVVGEPEPNPQYGCGATPVGFICDGIPCLNMDININNTNVFHIYGLEWSPTKIFWYIDGQCVRVENNTYGHILSELRIGIGTNMHEPIPPIPAYTNHLPAELVTDYVRIYKLKNDCDAVVNDCAFYFGGYEEKVKKSITIGCTNAQPIGTTQVLRATDFILLNGEFTVPLGSTFYADVSSCYE